MTKCLKLHSCENTVNKKHFTHTMETIKKVQCKL